MTRYDKFFATQGFSQSIVDRRVFFKRLEDDKIFVVCVYVDDSMIVANDQAVLDQFEAAFNARFPDSLASGLAADVSSDFTGVKCEKFTGESHARLELSCVGAIRDLRKKLAALPEAHRLSERTSTDMPMDERALSQPGKANTEALLPPERVKAAQEIAGLAGWIAPCARPTATSPSSL